MWLYNNVPFTDEMINDYTGFVYIITNLLTGSSVRWSKTILDS